ncbi:MAG: apolipoprotein N-acyltransferase [Novosphingobium sp.]
MQSARRLLPFSKIPKTLERPRLAVAVTAIGSGALAACGFQPLSLWPFTLLAVALLFELVVRTRTGQGAFLIGWYFGIGHFTLGNNWIATAFTYQANIPPWLGGIAVFLLSLYLAVFPALATLAAWFLVRPDRARAPFAALVLALGSTWIVTEWIRAWLFTGFSWNPLGIALLGQFQTRGLALITPWTGTYGLSGLLVLLAGLPGLCIRTGMRFSGAKRWIWALPALTAAAALATLMTVPDPWVRREEGAVHFTLVQPDLRQEIIDDPRWYEANFLKLARLSLPRHPGEKRVVFWPESGLGDYIRDGYPYYLYRLYTYGADPAIARARIGRVIGPYSLLLTGSVDLVMKDGDAVAARNSVTAIDGRGDILAGYSKAHLVPFGEYLPVRWLLAPLGAARFVAGDLDFRPGPGPQTYDFGSWGKAGIQICYEIIFSGKVTDPLNRPDYIYNPSNDGWFGSWGPPQHLAQARLRAIEEGVPVLRSTTTGISAVIDADGIVRHSIPLHTAGRIDGRIPPPHAPTLFARYGNALPLALAALLGLCAVSMVAFSRRRR